MISDMQIPIMLGSDKATQHLLAPVQDDLVAVQDYKVGDVFIFNNGLYKVTDDIDTSDPIIIGSGAGCNADVSTQTIYEETRNGLKSTNSWTDAYSKATSFILVTVEFLHNNNTMCESFLILKDSITNSDKYNVQGFYFTANSYGTYQVKYNTSEAIINLFAQGQSITTHTDKFYYD